MRAHIAVSLVVGFCFLLFKKKSFRIWDCGTTSLMLVLLEQQTFQLFFPSIYGCSCHVQSFLHSLIHPSIQYLYCICCSRMQITPLMHIYTCVVGVRIRRVSTGGPTADSAGEEGGADCAKSRRAQEVEHHWPREGDLRAEIAK